MLERILCGNPRHTPLIFLHGFLGCKEDWRELLPFFEKRYYCLAFDLPGHGKSAYSETLLKTVHEEMSQFSAKPLCIGYSMGGRIALQLQDTFSKMVLLSAHPGLLSEEERGAQEQRENTQIEELLSMPFEAFLEKWYAQPLFSTLSSSLRQELLKKRKNQNPALLAQILKQLRLSSQPRTSTLSCPTLFIYGEEDLKYRDIYCTLPPQIAVRSVPHAGHAVHLENPAACAQQITFWLEEQNADIRD